MLWDLIRYWSKHKTKLRGMTIISARGLLSEMNVLSPEFLCFLFTTLPKFMQYEG